ncbi:unnamed protein product [Microthlaspi erraticum]|uniref:Integrase catalytic domain-containing protein n=1 Tax=Microthlaspi erraticum TaxID=1685480 RepID=A0A6D2J316_9BRAS|nr:unnamed protein product [Microthlaspi erraticum]
MGPFKPSSNGHNYILVAVDYVSKWIEAIPCPACDAKVVIKLFRTIIFPRYGIPRVVISDGGSHFINKVFEKLMKSYGVKHKVATPITLKPVGKLRSPTDRLKAILEKTVSFTRKGLDCHLPVEVEYKALWAVKMLNFDIKAAQERRVVSREVEVKVGGTIQDHEVLPYGSLTLLNKRGKEFTVNGHRCKPYLGMTPTEEIITPLRSNPGLKVLQEQVLGRKGNSRHNSIEPRASSIERARSGASLMAVCPLQTTTLPPSSLGGTEAKFGGANSSSIELGVKTRKVVKVGKIQRKKSLVKSRELAVSFGAFWSIWDVRSMEDLAWTQLNWIRKGRRRSHLEDQLDHLLDQPVEFLNSTGQASTRSS